MWHPCKWPGSGFVFTQTTSEQGWGDCPSCLSLNHSDSARMVSSKGSHPGSWPGEVSGVLCSTPGWQMPIFPYRLYSGSETPLTHSSSESLLMPFLSVLIMICVAASGGFHLQSPSTPLFLCKEKEYLLCAYMLFFCMIREEREQERNASSLTCSKGNFLPITYQFHHFLQLCSSFCSDF